MPFIYDVGIAGYRTGIRLASLFSEKARKWEQGRRQQSLSLPPKKGERIWIHCASLGEYEQVRPLIEQLEAQSPSREVVLTFFSPSGLEHVQKKEPERLVFYLPMDGPTNAKKVLDAFVPDQVLFVKYEFWYYYWRAIEQRGIPFYLVSAVFRKSQPFFKWYGGWARRMLEVPRHFFVQDERSEALLRSTGKENITISGDTRYDRVSTIASNALEYPLIQQFKEDFPLLVGGSSWPPEEELLARLINREQRIFRTVIAPHDIGNAHLENIEKQLKVPHIRYSQAEKSGLGKAEVLIIDNIGMLSGLYQYAQVALIGGGFSGALHNILEPAAHGVPVLFGPKHEKFPEAEMMVKEGGAIEVGKEEDFQQQALALLTSSEKQKEASEKAKDFVEKRRGATEMIMGKMKEGW